MLEKYIDAATGRVKADLVLKNAKFVDVFSGDVGCGDIAVVGDRIVGIGEYEGKEELDCTGLVVTPGFINGHVHIESSLLSPEEFASLVVPRGTTTVIADPHEITNVCGMKGAEYIAKASENVPLDVKVMLPSCVPATPFETSGATLSGKDIEDNIGDDYIYGLAEFMNYPGVAAADPDVVKKLEAAHNAGKIVDGHSPTMAGKDLNAYLCGGITTDHECVSEKEIEEKISRGMYVHIRHGSSTRNLGNAKCINASNMRRFLLCTDDRHAADLKEKGDLDDALRRLVGDGLDPVWAVTCATLNCAECYGLKYRGAIAPFYFADIAIVDNLKDFNVKYVFKEGKMVARDGKALFDIAKKYLPEDVLNTVHLGKVTADDFKLPLTGDKAKAITIGEGGLVTGCEIVDVKSENGDVVLEGTDLLKMAVVERHGRNGNIGRGLFKGYGFKGGALGITIAHDSHNVILMGDDNECMAAAAKRLGYIGGGMCVATKEGDVYSVTLDIGGLMSSKDAESLIKEENELLDIAYKMGVKREYEVFMSLAFLSLAVIPKLKLLDTGLFDVEKFDFTDINEV